MRYPPDFLGLIEAYANNKQLQELRAKLRELQQKNRVMSSRKKNISKIPRNKLSRKDFNKPATVRGGN